MDRLPEKRRIYEEAEEVEAEIVSEDGQSARTSEKEAEKVLRKLKFTLSAAAIIIGILMEMLGFILASTIIGIILAVPLIFIGVFLIWLGIKIMFLRGGGFFVKTFRF